jgi:hypothetical protein
MDMGKLEARHKLIVVRKLCGQVSGEPKGVLDQSLERMSLPISPPPDKNSGKAISWVILCEAINSKENYTVKYLIYINSGT